MIRADASVSMGVGHIMRCLALAEAWREDGGRVVLASHCEGTRLLQRLEASDITLVPVKAPSPDPTDLESMLTLLEDVQADWVALDGYHLPPTYQQAVRGCGPQLLVLDDLAHWPEYHADVLLNQNVHAEKLVYSCDPDAVLLLGPRYAILRREFAPWRSFIRGERGAGYHLLVTVGGTDPQNVTLKVIRALRILQLPQVDVRLVVGPSSPHLESLRKAVVESPQWRVIVDANDMPELMAWADLAISAAGSTPLELAFMGLPAILLVVAENQRAVAEGLAKMGTAVNLGWHDAVDPRDIAQAVGKLLVSPEERRAMTDRGRSLVDGFGVDRLLMRLRDRSLRLQLARQEDAKLIWTWVNDPVVRAASFSGEPIPWDHHASWYHSRLCDPSCRFYIIIDRNDVPIGQIRFELDGEEAVVSVALDSAHRGRGYGSKAIKLASQKLFQASRVARIHAYVKQHNEASLRAFAKAGYQNAGILAIGGQPATHLISGKSDKAES